MDTEYDWEKGTSIINEKKTSHQTPKMLQSAWLQVNWTKKYLDMFTLSIQLVVRKDFSHEPFHDQVL